MNASAVIPLNYSPNDPIIVPHFGSLWVEKYFFRAFIDDFDFNTFNGNLTYIFSLSAESLSPSEAELLQQFYLTSKKGGWRINTHDINDKGVSSSVILLESSVSFRDDDAHDPQKATYKFHINGRGLEYFKKLQEIGYATIDWQVLESLQGSYTHYFYRYLKLLQKNQVTTVGINRRFLLNMFQIEVMEFRQWKLYKNNFLAEVLAEITNHPTHPIAFEYSTNEYFDKSIPEDRHCKYLYIRLLVEEQAIIKTPSPFMSMKPIYRLITNLKKQSNQGFFYLLVALIGLILGNASALVNTIAESLMLIPFITVYLLVCVGLIYQHLHPSQA
jgi:hypothetical protein